MDDSITGGPVTAAATESPTERLDGRTPQLAALIEFVWACAVTARREDRIATAIKYGRC